MVMVGYEGGKCKKYKSRGGNCTGAYLKVPCISFEESDIKAEKKEAYYHVLTDNSIDIEYQGKKYKRAYKAMTNLDRN